jgi:hypothetical protein
MGLQMPGPLSHWNKAPKKQKEFKVIPSLPYLSLVHGTKILNTQRDQTNKYFGVYMFFCTRLDKRRKQTAIARRRGLSSEFDNDVSKQDGLGEIYNMIQCKKMR